MARLLYQGHGSCRIESARGMVIYLDPFAGGGYDKPGDLILVTHEHSDHNQVQLVPPKKDCRVIRAGDLLQNGIYAGCTVGEVEIRAVEAYNQNHARETCVGYLLKLDGKKLYFSGDTSHTEAMKRLAGEGLDWAFFPTDGVYNMNARQAAECAREVGARHSVPIHTKPGELFDPAIAELFQVPGRVILLPGQVREV